MFKVYCLILFAAIGVSAQTPAASPSPTPQITHEDLKRAQKELREELEALKKEAGEVMEKRDMQRTIQAEKDRNAEQRARLSDLEARLAAAALVETERDALREEAKHLKIMVSEREKIIKELERKQRKQHKRLLISVFAAIAASVAAIIGFAQ